MPGDRNGYEVFARWILLLVVSVAMAPSAQAGIKKQPVTRPIDENIPWASGVLVNDFVAESDRATIIFEMLDSSGSIDNVLVVPKSDYLAGTVGPVQSIGGQVDSTLSFFYFSPPSVSGFPLASLFDSGAEGWTVTNGDWLEGPLAPRTVDLIPSDWIGGALSFSGSAGITVENLVPGDDYVLSFWWRAGTGNLQFNQFVMEAIVDFAPDAYPPVLSQIAELQGFAGVTFCDVDRSGTGELLAFDQFQGDLQLLELPDLTVPTRLNTFPSLSGDFACATDADNDGDDDFYILQRDQVRFVEKTNNWKFASGSIHNLTVSGGTSYSGLVLSDANCDGFPDVVVFGTYTSTSTRILIYDDQTGTLVDQTPSSVQAVNSVYHASLADFDNDGIPEVALAAYDGIYMLKAPSGLPCNTLEAFQVAPSAGGNPYTQVDWVDVDEDGDMDLHAYANQAGNWVIYSHNGVLGPPSQLAGTAPNRMLSNWGDMNRDGRLDMIGLSVNAMAESVTLSDNTYSLLPTYGIDARTGGFFDYDHDGDDDLIYSDDDLTVMNSLSDQRESHNWIEFFLEGNPGLSALGASVVLETGNGTLARRLHSGDGVARAMLPNRLKFGLGNESVAQNVSVSWPGGAQTSLGTLDANRTYYVAEGCTNLCPDYRFDDSQWVQSMGSVWVDFDQDGDMDLFVSSWESPDRLYENDGTGNLQLTNQSALQISNNTRSFAWGDYDNNGYPDLFIGGRGQNRLLKNVTGSLTDVTPPNVAGDPLDEAFSPCWADYDRDGDLDLYVSSVMESKLFRNEGGDTFVDVTPSALAESDQSKAMWVDYDNDGWMDLYRMYRNAPNQMLRNLGAGAFQETPANGLQYSGNASSASWADYDNDGDLDVYLANLGTDVLLRNDSGVFVSVAFPVPALGDESLAAHWFDIDYDGDLDLYIAGGNATANRLLLQQNGSFVEQPSFPASTRRASRSASACDTDSDGDLDLFVSTVQGFDLQLESSGYTNGANWLEIALEGTVSNRSAIGARISVEIDGEVQTREVTGGAGLSANSSLRQWIGLGSSPSAVNVTVDWPSGVSALYAGLAKNQRHFLVEESPTGVIEPEEELETTRFSFRVSPNPMHAGTVVYLELPAPEAVSVVVYNLRGQLVRSFQHRLLPAGSHQIGWDATDNSGRGVAAGVYSLRVTAGGNRATRQITVLGR